MKLMYNVVHLVQTCSVIHPSHMCKYNKTSVAFFCFLLFFFFYIFISHHISLLKPTSLKWMCSLLLSLYLFEMVIR